MISIVLPVRDEPALGEFLLNLHEVMEGTPWQYEVLVIFGDRETLHPDVPGLPNQRILTSYGDSLERAILLGFSISRGERIVVLDADGSHPPDKIPDMIRALDKYEMVVASRFLPGAKFEQSAFRRLVSKLFILWARIYGSRLTDPMSGFFALRRELLDGAKFKPIHWKTCLELELLKRPEVLEVPIHFNKRNAGFSKASLLTGLKTLWDIMLVGGGIDDS
ncbi:MAG: glycosyltransferase [Deltaproteobacteria bacterium]|nr:glycosyltransferase [Deltaproteobacteria bacterium]